MRIQTRGAGEVARSLNVRGEDIYERLSRDGTEHCYTEYIILGMEYYLYKRRNMVNRASSQHLRSVHPNAFAPVSLALAW